jgi:Flp pilus assembly protein TadD/thiol-disulfide isomerase/thioredoxin
VASSPTDGESTDEYAEGWRQLQDHLRDGQSWSGNERHCVFLNTGTPTFADASAVSGLDFADDGRGMAVCDWDHDGDLDLWFTNRTGPRARYLRNDSTHENSYIAFRLHSNTLNCDAIGAEVEIFFEGDDSERHVRTLRAGSGFISQSSKWVHFGVPAGREVSHAIVRWPGGEATEHRGLHAGARWLLSEDDPRPDPAPHAERKTSLSPGALPTPPFSTTARIPIINPLPLLGLETEAADGRLQPLQFTPGTGVLLTLWADWCVNCKRELAQLQEEEALLQAAGLRVLAVSVDEASDRSASDAFLDRISWSFERAYATEDLLKILGIVQRVLLDRPQASAIPTSYLIDGAGRLQVIYRGPVDAAQLIEDSKSFDMPPVERRSLHGRFPGWWSTENVPTRFTILAIQLRNKGYPGLAAEYLKRITIRGDVEDAPEYAVNRMVGSEINTGVQLMNQGETLEAIESFRRALNLRPRHALANKLLGSCLQRTGNARDAIPHLELSAELASEDAETHNDLGLAYVDIGRSEDAQTAFGEAVRIDPALAKAQFNLGICHARENDLPTALVHIQEAVRLKQDYTQAWVTLGRIHTINHHPEQAISALERALALHDSDPDVLLLLGQSLIEAARPADARALLPKLRALDTARADRLQDLLGP